MCFFLSAILPKETKMEAIRPIIETYKMGFSPVNNGSIESQLKSGDIFLRATRKTIYCDCDTVIGCESTGTAKRTLMESKKVKKLKKKGWNLTQIDEWIEDRIKTKKSTKGKKWWPELQRKKADEWINFLNELLEVKSVSRVGLLKHWYQGNLDSEEIKIRETKRLDLNQALFDDLLKMDEDVLYEFYKQ